MSDRQVGPSPGHPENVFPFECPNGTLGVFRKSIRGTQDEKKGKISDFISGIFSEKIPVIFRDKFPVFFHGKRWTTYMKVTESKRIPRKSRPDIQQSKKERLLSKKCSTMPWEESREMFGNDLWIFPSKSCPDFRGPEKRAMPDAMPDVMSDERLSVQTRLYPFLDRKLGPSGTYGISLFSLAASLFSLSLYR
jgi:hypothetical protein